MKVKNNGRSVEIDLHGMRKDEAIFRLEKYLDFAPDTLERVTVIHGFNSGTVLRDAVRDFSHKRVKQVFKGLTDGQTIFILK